MKFLIKKFFEDVEMSVLAYVELDGILLYPISIVKEKVVFAPVVRNRMIPYNKSKQKKIPISKFTPYQLDVIKSTIAYRIAKLMKDE